MQDVEIYPTSWYYNACVQGFLEVLAWGLDVDEKKGEEIVVNEILKKDGRAVIPGDIMTLAFSPRGNPHKDYRLKEVPEELPYLKRIGWWWVEKSKKTEGINASETLKSTCRSLLGSNKTFYPNLLPHNEKLKPDIFLNQWFSFEYDGDFRCGFCNGPCAPSYGEKDKFTYMSLELSELIGSSIKKFPNSFWNANPSLIMCKRCRSYFLCFHLVSKNRFFINSDSFFVNWYLNRLLAGKVDNIRHQSLLDAMQYDQQLRKAVGSWGLQNMELLIFERNGVEYYPISANLARLLLIPEITLLIGQIANNRVWEFILQERFDYLPTMVYKSLRALINMKNDGKDPEVVFEGPGNTLPVNNLIQLYYAIKQQIASNNGGGKMSHINLKEIREAAAEAPINPARNADKNFVYRLLELTRLNKKTEVYHLLLRIYLTSEEKKEFPPPLARLFETNDCELFKTGIYAFIAGLIRSEKITN